MLRRGLKSLLLGWVLGFIFGAVFFGIAYTIVNPDQGWLLVASLSLVIYAVLAFRRKWKPLWIAVPLGAVINPLTWLGLLILILECSYWGDGGPWCSILSSTY